MSDTKNKTSKTKLARATAIQILVKANRPMAATDLIAKVLATRAVRDAGIPKGTVSAQISFEVNEAEPKIVRHGRGVYAAAGVKPPAEAGS